MKVELDIELIKLVCEVSEIAQHKLESSLETWKQSLIAQQGIISEKKTNAINEKIKCIESDIEKTISVNGILILHKILPLKN